MLTRIGERTGAMGCARALPASNVALKVPLTTGGSGNFGDARFRALSVAEPKSCSSGEKKVSLGPLNMIGRIFAAAANNCRTRQKFAAATNWRQI